MIPTSFESGGPLEHSAGGPFKFPERFIAQAPDGILTPVAYSDACITTRFLPAVAYTRGGLAALHRPILRMAIDRGAVAPVESLAVELRSAAPKFF